MTSLADGGPGTLRAALDDPNPRVVVFRVGGTITLEKALRIAHPFVTVAGQTAPGDGILLRDFGLVIETHDVLAQHLRIRPGNEGRVEPEDNDALQVNGAHNVVLDHLSLSWGEDEVVQTWDGAHDVTFSWCLVSEALDKSRHPKGRHGGGFLIGDGSDRITVHHSLLAHNDFRSPLIIHSGAVDLVENVAYDWGRSAGEIYDERGWSTHANVIGNRYIPGPSSNSGTPDFVINKGATAGSRLPKLFAKGNEGPHRSAAGPDEFTLFALGWTGGRLPDECRASEPFDSRRVSPLRGAHVLEAVLERVGATSPLRDAVDRRVVDSVRKKEGRMINSPRDVGGIPRCAAASRRRTPTTTGCPTTGSGK